MQLEEIKVKIIEMGYMLKSKSQNTINNKFFSIK